MTVTSWTKPTTGSATWTPVDIGFGWFIDGWFVGGWFSGPAWDMLNVSGNVWIKETP